MHKVISEEEKDSQNVTAYTFSHTSNTQRDDSNVILTSKKLDKSDDLEETLNDLTVNDYVYYVSDSANANDTIGDPGSNPKIVPHNGDGKIKNVMDTRNRILQQALLSNRILPILTTKINPRIDNSIATCGGTPHTLAMPRTKGLIIETVRSGVQVNWTPRHVR